MSIRSTALFAGGESAHTIGFTSADIAIVGKTMDIVPTVVLDFTTPSIELSGEVFSIYMDFKHPSKGFFNF